MTSRPAAGRTPRLGHVWGDRTSDAERSGCRGSWGAIAMGLRASPDYEYGCGSTVCHSIRTEMRMCHTVSQRLVAGTLQLDSRTSCKEYKLSNCILRICPLMPPAEPWLAHITPANCSPFRSADGQVRRHPDPLRP